MRIPRSFVLLNMLLAIASGCGKGKVALPTVPVEGTVTFQTKPLEGGQIVFIHESGQAVTADVLANGTYKLLAYQGKNQIAISSFVTDPPSQNPNARPRAPIRKTLIPDRYSSCNTSNLSFDVQADSQRFDIALTP